MLHPIKPSLSNYEKLVTEALANLKKALDDDPENAFVSIHPMPGLYELYELLLNLDKSVLKEPLSDKITQNITFIKHHDHSPCRHRNSFVRSSCLPRADGPA